MGDMLTVTATYRDGSLAADDNAITLAQAHTPRVVAPDTDNKAPRFLDDDSEVITTVERAVEENTGSGPWPIGDPVEASDPMPAGTQSGRIGHVDVHAGRRGRSVFRHQRRAPVSCMTKADLDYETKQSYTVRVTATDPSGLSATVTVTIEVVPVNEDPVIDGEAPGGICGERQDSCGDFHRV